VLGRFALGAGEHGEIADTAVLANVRVLGEGVDLRCESVVFADPKASVVEIVQAIGRALRQNLGEGKTATIVVPVFLAAGERPDDMLTSASYRPLVRVLHALAAHDARVLDMLAVPQASGRAAALREALEPEGEREEGRAGEGAEQGELVEDRFLLRFSTLRDPAVVADFVRLRVINPERRDWRRGYLAARRRHALHADLRIPLDAIDYDPETGTSYPVGAWISEQRRAYAGPSSGSTADGPGPTSSPTPSTTSRPCPTPADRRNPLAPATRGPRPGRGTGAHPTRQPGHRPARTRKPRPRQTNGAPSAS
jgi:hypothetical protein